MFLRHVACVGIFLFMAQSVVVGLDDETVWNLAVSKGFYKNIIPFQPMSCNNASPSLHNSLSCVGGFYFNSQSQQVDSQNDFFEGDCSMGLENTVKSAYLVLPKNGNCSHQCSNFYDHLIHDGIFQLDLSFINALHISLSNCFFHFEDSFLMLSSTDSEGNQISLPFAQFDVLTPIFKIKSKSLFHVTIFNNTQHVIHVVPSKTLSVWDDIRSISIQPYQDAVISVHIINRINGCGDLSGGFHREKIVDFYDFDNHLLFYCSEPVPGWGASSDECLCNQEQNIDIFSVSLFAHQINVRKVGDGFLVDSF